MGTPRKYLMILAIAVGILLAAVALFTGEDRTDGAAILFMGSVAVLAGALIYLLATDDYEARKQIYGPEAADRRSTSDADG
jgi:hypothetical protein